VAKVADKYFVSDPWKIIEKGFDPAYSRVSESIFALSNENIGVRGNFDEGGSVDSLRGSYVNGVYEITQLNKSYKGIIDKTHFMIPAVDWLNTTILLDSEVLDLGKVKFSDFSRELDLRAGTLTRNFIWHTADGKNLELTFIRFMDMTNNERAYQRFIFKPLNFSGELELTMASLLTWFTKGAMPVFGVIQLGQSGVIPCLLCRVLRCREKKYLQGLMSMLPWL